MAFYRPHSNLKEFTGRFTEISHYKAVVEFNYQNKQHRALLKYEKLKVDGQPIPLGAVLEEFVKVSTKVKFLCHTFDDRGVDRCGWFITCAWVREPMDDYIIETANVVQGLYNYSGIIEELSQRQGIMKFFDENGKEDKVFFLASRLHVFGKLIPAKTRLWEIPNIDEGGLLMFDAVPNNLANKDRVPWFATVVWKGKKPDLKYDCPHLNTKTPSWSTQIQMAISSPHSMFIRTHGQILNILSDEWGLVLASIKKNIWQSVLFHRKDVSLFGHNLATFDLRKVLHKGDQVQLVAASSPKILGVKWVASHVWVEAAKKPKPAVASTNCSRRKRKRSRR